MYFDCKGIPQERGSEAIRDDRPLIAAIQLPEHNENVTKDETSRSW